MTIHKISSISLPQVVFDAIRKVTASGFFQEGIIGGSWCFPFYDAVIGIKYELRTLDVDFMISEALQKRDDLISDLGRELEDEGFISTIDYNTSLQKFFKDGMEIEFLTPRRGNRDDTLLIRPFNVTAQPLPFLNILFNEPISIMVEDLHGIVRIPSPRSLLLHKMIIAHRRQKESKKEKDLDQCKVLSLYCKYEEVQELSNHFNFGRSTWRDISASCQFIGIPELKHPVQRMKKLPQGAKV